MCIYNGQVKKHEHQGKITVSYEVDILGISMEKGGVLSLLMVIWLKEKLNEEEISFVMDMEYFFKYAMISRMQQKI